MKRLLLLVLCASSLAQKTATLTWADTANPPATTYDVYRAGGVCPPTGDPPWNAIAHGLTAKTYADPNLAPGDYCYSVEAVLGSQRAHTAGVTANVPAPPPQIVAPTHLTVTVADTAPSYKPLPVSAYRTSGTPQDCAYASLPAPGGTPGGTLCTVPAFAPPTQGQTWTDHNLGGHMTALTGSTFLHGYALPSPYSATNKWIAVNGGNGFFVLNPANPTAPMVQVANVRIPLWHPTNDDIFYYFTDTQLVQYTITTRSRRTALNFKGRLSKIRMMRNQPPTPRGQPRAIATGGSTHISGDGWVTIWSEPEHAVCAVDMVRAKSFCGDYASAEADPHGLGVNIDFTMAYDIDAPTGKRYVALMALPALSLWSVDEANQRLVFVTRGPEMGHSQGFQDNGNDNGDCEAGENCFGNPHADAVSIAGRPYIVTGLDRTYGPCERTLAAMPVYEGREMINRRVDLMVLGYCSSYPWPDGHVGCATRAQACAMSWYTPDPAPFGGQIIAISFAPTATTVTKYCFHHSQPMGSDTYWYQPRVAMSPDGKWMAWDSNYGQQDSGDGTAHEIVTQGSVN